NLVFMQYELGADGSLTPLPKRNIDTGLGLDRLAAILQDVPSAFETEHFRPLVELGEQLSGRRYDDDAAVTRALRILADHGRGRRASGGPSLRASASSRISWGAPRPRRPRGSTPRTRFGCTTPTASPTS